MPYLNNQKLIIVACTLFCTLPSIVVAVAEVSSQQNNTDASEQLSQSISSHHTNEKIETLISEIENEIGRINAPLLTHKDLKTYQNAIALREDANINYLNSNYSAAIENYEKVLVKLNVINKNIDKSYRRSVEQGFDAIKSGNASIAITAFTRALAFRESSSEAINGLARANGLENVLKHIEKGDQARSEGDIETAAKAYNDALAIDPETTLAQAKLETLQRLKSEKQFAIHMKNGSEALNEKKFSLAAKQFESAIAIDPNSSDAQSRLKFTLRELKRNLILDHLSEALSAQQNKQWAIAVKHFDSALKLDPNLETAQTGKQQVLKQLETQ